VRALLAGRPALAASLQSLATNLAILAVNVATGLLTARVLGPDGRGRLAAMLLWPQFLAYGLNLGVPRALTFQLRNRPQEEPGLMGAALWLSLLLGLVASASGIFLIPEALHAYSQADVRFAQAVMPLAIAVLLSSILTSWQQGKGDFRRLNLSRYSAPLLTLAGLVGLALTGHLGARSAALCYLFGSLPATAWNLRSLLGQLRPRPRRTSFSALLHYGIRSYGADLLGTLGSQLDRLLVLGFLDPRELGLYVVSQNLARLLGSLEGAASLVLFPRASGRSTDEVLGMTDRALSVTNAAALLAAALLALAGPAALSLLYGNRFAAASAVFRLLLLEAVLAGAANLMGQALLAVNRPGVVTLLSGLSVGSSALLLLWLVPTDGLVGAGLALAAGTGMRLLASYLCFPLLLRCRPPRLLPRRSDLFPARQPR
jgi:O-antigen/teichoic acid export membrane protein